MNIKRDFTLRITVVYTKLGKVEVEWDSTKMTGQGGWSAGEKLENKVMQTKKRRLLLCRVFIDESSSFISWPVVLAKHSAVLL